MTAANPWAAINAALDAWLEQRLELDAQLTELLEEQATRDGEPVSRVEVDERGHLLARLGRAGVVWARDSETLLERATAAVEARRKAVRETLLKRAKAVSDAEREGKL